MKIKLHHILITFSLGFISPGALNYSFAQDATMRYYEYEDDVPTFDMERERIIHSPGESTDPNTSKSSTNTTPNANSNNHSAAKDSASFKFPVQKGVRPVATEALKREKPKEGDDSILSFNFLYYIIQKYKFQDIID